MKVYLAGKITGDPNYREKFAAAAKKLEERAGVTVISPAVTPEGLKKADYLKMPVRDFIELNSEVAEEWRTIKH